jgi:chorismate mutase-like protein
MNLDDWRSRINNLDDEILKLLNQRGTAALRIGELKRQQDLPYFSPEREAQVLDRLVALNDGPLGADAIRVIWREILSASLALEHPLPIAYLGPPGTFTHQAATRRFGSSAQLLPVHTIAEIFDEVERGRAEYGVVPVENSTEGAVNVTLDRLIDSDVTITGEMTLDISQHLISRATDLSGVKVVCSHPHGLAQAGPGSPRTCRRRRPRRPRRPRGRWSGRATTPRWPPSPPTWPLPCTGCPSCDPASRTTRPTRPASSSSGGRRCRPPGGTRRRSSSR